MSSTNVSWPFDSRNDDDDVVKVKKIEAFYLNVEAHTNMKSWWHEMPDTRIEGLGQAGFKTGDIR